LPPITEAPKKPEILDGTAKVIQYSKGSNFQTGKIEVTTNTTIRLPLFDFPNMQVRVNGKLVEHNHEDCREEEFCLGLITFKLAPGNYTLETKLVDTPVRTIGNYLTLTSVVIVMWLILKKDDKVYK
jgi:hypothetical protein